VLYVQYKVWRVYNAWVEEFEEGAREDVTKALQKDYKP
jgi:hypothetical protein